MFALQPLDAAGASAARAYTGVIGPFDADCLRSGATPVFEGIPMPTGQAAKEVCVPAGFASSLSFSVYRVLDHFEICCVGMVHQAAIPLMWLWV